MTPFKLNWTNSIDNINELEKEIETTVKDLNDKVDLLEQENEQLEQLVEQMEEVEEKSVTITENGTTNVTPSTGKYAMTKVTVTTDVAGGNVIIDNNVTYNSTYGFKSLITEIDLTDFTLPSNVITLAQFLSDFVNLKEIKNLTIPNNITELSSCFNRCSSLITIPNINTSNITRMQYCFYNCSSLENVPILDLSSITGTGLNSLFGECSSLTNGSLHNIIKSLVTTESISNKRLAYLGLSSEQATICTTFDEWTTLTSKGWTTGYES